MMGELYKLDFQNGKSYIGITTKTSEERFKAHRRFYSSGARDTVLSRAWRKYGEPALVKLAVVENKLLAETEIKAIAVFKTISPFGYNMMEGGQVSPMTNPEVARKLKGRKMSAASIEKMKEAHKTRWTKEARERVSSQQKGKKLSDEQRVATSKRFKGKKLSAETVAKRSGDNNWTRKPGADLSYLSKRNSSKESREAASKKLTSYWAAMSASERSEENKKRWLKRKGEQNDNT